MCNKIPGPTPKIQGGLGECRALGLRVDLRALFNRTGIMKPKITCCKYIIVRNPDKPNDRNYVFKPLLWGADELRLRLC